MNMYTTSHHVLFQEYFCKPNILISFRLLPILVKKNGENDDNWEDTTRASNLIFQEGELIARSGS